MRLPHVKWSSEFRARTLRDVVQGTRYGRRLHASLDAGLKCPEGCLPVQGVMFFLIYHNYLTMGRCRIELTQLSPRGVVRADSDVLPGGDLLPAWVYEQGHDVKSRTEDLSSRVRICIKRWLCWVRVMTLQSVQGTPGAGSWGTAHARMSTCSRMASISLLGTLPGATHCAAYRLLVPTARFGRVATVL